MESFAYDLVSHGKDTSGTNQCYGRYNETSRAGWGPGFQYSCVHSGLIASSGDISTVWYNYVLASAGTIIDENTTEQNPASNTTPAIESICPKGWTLPNKTQIDSNRNVSSFSPVLGGYYYNSGLYNMGAYGLWWGSTAYNGADRYFLGYNDSNLYAGNTRRIHGFYIRCVAKQKTITDLAYMQDVTDEL